MTSPYSQQALVHLKKLKPYDGWSIETQSFTKQVRLLRRSIPLTDNYFHDIHYDSISGNVVGILTKGPPAKGQLLIDSSGKPIGKTAVVAFVTTWSANGGPPSTSTTSRNRSTPTTPRTPTTQTSSFSEPQLSDDQNRELIKYAAYAIGAAFVLRILLNAAFTASILILPAVYFYAVQTLPSLESFDAKKELKRVLRGHHLPEDHVDKPRGWLSETMARVQATVATELATGLGYSVSQYSILHAMHVSTVTVPSVNRGFIWIGVFGKWRYIYSTELEADPQIPG